MTNNAIAILEEGNLLLVDSRLIAERLGIEHESFLKTLDTYQSQVEQAFGILRFEIGKIDGRGRPARYALLSEDQATFVMTLSRNTAKVVQCKIDLVVAFSEAKRLLKAPAEDPILASLKSALEVRQQQIVMEEKQREHDRRLTTLEQERDAARQELLALPPASSPIPEETIDAKIRRIVNAYSADTGIPQSEVFKTLYTQFYYRYKRRVTQEGKESKIQAFVRLGLIDSLYGLARELFGGVIA
jgi:phage regulator Rha-like protein